MLTRRRFVAAAAGGAGSLAISGRAQSQIVGKPAPRLHGFGHVTGFGQYSEHMTQPGMVFMKSLLSPHPHARVKRVDTTKAEQFTRIPLTTPAHCELFAVFVP